MRASRSVRVRWEKEGSGGAVGILDGWREDMVDGWVVRWGVWWTGENMRNVKMEEKGNEQTAAAIASELVVKHYTSMNAIIGVLSK